MKAIILSLFIVTSLLGNAQTCDSLIYFRNRATAVFTLTYKYTKKDIVHEESFDYTVNKSAQEKKSTSFQPVRRTAKGKAVYQHPITFLCTGDTLKIPMSNTALAGPDEGIKEENKNKATFIAYPYTMEVGQKFEDLKAERTIIVENAESYSHWEISNRKVIGKQTITTAAGTWECYKISYNSSYAEYRERQIFRAKEVHTQTRNQPGKVVTYSPGQTEKITIAPSVSYKLRVVEWFSPKIGIVKTVTYSESGDEMASNELTSIKN